MRILVVEDDRPLADAIVRGLRRDAFAVDVAHDGEAALEKAAIVEYDVIVLDRDLPVVHGDEVCRRLGGEGVTWSEVGPDAVRAEVRLLTDQARLRT